jgi:tRNA G10  N-methylase Trm11
MLFPELNQIQEFRKAVGLTQKELAQLLGVNSTSIYRWEHEITKPSQLALDKIKQISEKTNLDKSLVRLLLEKNDNQILSNDLKFEESREYDLVPMPWVSNAPKDQQEFHKKLINIQLKAFKKDLQNNFKRLSLVDNVIELGKTAQSILEQPKSKALSWNSNYGAHGWHRYVGRFPPHLVRSLINAFGADSNSVICDPFSGSGTTAVECRLLGIPFIGIEICPLSYLISKTKSSFPLDSKSLQNMISEFEKFYSAELDIFLKDRITYSHEDILNRKGNLIEHFTNIEKWFTPQALLGVSIAVQFGMQQTEFNKDAFLLALSAKMRSIGNVDVDVVRAEYSKKPRENVDVLKLVTRQLIKMAKDIELMSISHEDLVQENQNITLFEASVLDVDLPNDSIDHIITSPPYGVEAISYLRTHLLSYRSLKPELNHNPYDTKEKTIGSEYTDWKNTQLKFNLEKISPTFKDFFENVQVKPEHESRKVAMMQFFEDLYEVGIKMSKWLKKKGKIAFVIGNKRLGQDIIPADQIIIETYRNLGLILNESIKHKLKTNNSNSQVPWQERVIDEEYILIFEKLGSSHANA